MEKCEKKMGFKEIHPNWPDFDFKSKHYLCMCRIDSQKPFALSGHQHITHAHYSNGNLGRHWRALHASAKVRNKQALRDLAEPDDKTGIWRLYIEGHRIELTVEYIDPQETPPVRIDPSRIDHKANCSKQSGELLEQIQQKLRENPVVDVRGSLQGEALLEAEVKTSLILMLNYQHCQ